MTTALATSYLSWTDTESVTVVTKRSSGNTSITVAKALRRSLNRQEQQLVGGLLSGDEIVWNIPDALLTASPNGSAVIREGDTIGDGTDTFTVTRVSLLSKANRWRCICQKEQV